MSDQREVLREALENSVAGISPEVMSEHPSASSTEGPFVEIDNSLGSRLGIFRRRKNSGDVYRQAHDNEGLLAQVVRELPGADLIIRKGRPTKGVYDVVKNDHHRVFGAEILVDSRRSDIAQGVATSVVWLSFSGLHTNVRGNVPHLPYWVVGVEAGRSRFQNNLLIYPLAINNMPNSGISGVAFDDRSGRFDIEGGLKSRKSNIDWVKLGDAVIREIDEVVFGSNRDRSKSAGSADKASERRAISFDPLELFQVRVGKTDMERLANNPRMLATASMEGLVAPDGEIIISADSEGSFKNSNGSRSFLGRDRTRPDIRPSDPRLIRLTDEVADRFSVWDKVASLAARFNLAEKILAEL